MRLLLDTHVFPWYVTADISLPVGVRDAIRDPFDRILVAQSLQHGLILASVDSQIRAYPVPMLPSP